MNKVSCLQMCTNWIVAGDVSGFVRIFDRTQYQVKDILFGLEHPVSKLLITKEYVIGSDDSGAFAVWELSHGNMRFKDQLESKIESMCFNQGKLVVGTNQGKWTVYDGAVWRKEASGDMISGPVSEVQYAQGVCVIASSRTNKLTAIRFPQSYHNAAWSSIHSGSNEKEDIERVLVQKNEAHQFGDIRYMEIVRVDSNDVQLYLIGTIDEGFVTISIT